MEPSSPDLFINDTQPDTPLSSSSVEESVDNSSPDSSISSCRPERRKQRRNPAVLVEWIEDHPFNPYPTKQEKQQLATLSGMTLRQLNDWFANARRNIKKLGYDIWRKKRNGVHNQKTFSNPPVSSAPPNVVADINDLGRRLSSPQYTNMSAVPFYGSTIGPGGCGLQPPRSLSHSQTPYARLNCNSAALFSSGTAGWFTPTRPLFRPSPYTVPLPTNHDCTCSLCKPNPATTVFNMPVQSTAKLTGIPSLTAIPWSSGNNDQFSCVDGQGEDTWSSNGSPESCPDIAALSLPPSSNVGVCMIKEELVSSSNCCGLSGTNGVS